MGAAFQNTSLLDVATQHRKGLTGGPFLFYNEVLQFTLCQMTEYQGYFGKTETAPFPFLIPEGEQQGDGLPRVYFLFLAEGQGGSQTQRDHS